MKSLVSIIIPVYNAEAYLEQCINSILNQLYQNIEIIIINDGSSDNSLNIIKEFEKKDKRIKVINKENSGVSSTRNIGISIASGDYLMFVDSDDYIEKNMILDMLQAMRENNVDGVRCNSNIFDIKNNFKHEIFGSFSNKKIVKKEINELLERFLTEKNTIGSYTPLLLMKRSVVPRFETELFYLEDVNFYIKLFINIEAIYFLDKNLYNYRYNKQSSSKKIENVKNNIFNLMTSMKKNKDLLLENGLLTQKIEQGMNANTLSLIISKIKIYSVLGFWKTKKITKEIFNNTDIRNTVLNLNCRSISNKKKLLYYLVRYKLYSLLSVAILIAKK